MSTTRNSADTSDIAIAGTSVYRSGASQFNVVGAGATHRWFVADASGNDNGEVKNGFTDSPS